jgi:mannose-6-phosphate isomerase-like protein (cupin superfamily)
LTGVPEAPLDRSEHGLQAGGEGWYVLNAREAVWGESDEMGVYTRLGEGPESRFAQVGFNIGVLWPGQPACMYHREPNQEGFLIVAGECILFVEGEERRMKKWDYFHCPPDTDHVMVAAGDEPCVAVAFGTRFSRGVVYSEFEPARRYGGAVEKETTDPKEAYAGMEVRDTAYKDGWLPDL